MGSSRCVEPRYLCNYLKAKRYLRKLSGRKKTIFSRKSPGDQARSPPQTAHLWVLAYHVERANHDLRWRGTEQSDDSTGLTSARRRQRWSCRTATHSCCPAAAAQNGEGICAGIARATGGGSGRGMDCGNWLRSRSRHLRRRRGIAHVPAGRVGAPCGAPHDHGPCHPQRASRRYAEGHAADARVSGGAGVGRRRAPPQSPATTALISVFPANSSATDLPRATRGLGVSSARECPAPGSAAAPGDCRVLALCRELTRSDVRPPTVRYSDKMSGIRTTASGIRTSPGVTH
jgi:hypothetical protein